MVSMGILAGLSICDNDSARAMLCSCWASCLHIVGVNNESKDVVESRWCLTSLIEGPDMIAYIVSYLSSPRNTSNILVRARTVPDLSNDVFEDR